MRHKFRYLFVAFLFLFFAGSSLIQTPKVSAAGEKYVFHYQKDKKAETEKALNTLTGGTRDDVLQYTYVDASNGVFGTNKLKLNYQATGPTDVPDGSVLNSDGHFFGGAGGTSSYDCNNYTINVILLAQSPVNLDQGLKFQVWLTSATKNGTGVVASAVPRSCRPSGAGLADVPTSHPPTQTAKATGDVIPPTPPNGSGNDSCESSGGGFSLNWAICAAYQGIQSTTDWMLNNIIAPLLSSTPICLPGNSTCQDTIYQIWSNFRIYGDIFLVITLLVIVFGESIGGGVIEAYTAKKVLPRILVAAILLNLSIYIMAFAIDLTNITGQGIGALLTGPLHGQGMFTIKPGNITAGAIFGTAIGAGLLAGAFVINAAGIALLLLGLMITGALSILGVFFTLIIRQSIILALVLVSPIAFALWCLPNTESWFKRWWSTFFQMLLVYPMVIVLFAVSDVMSYLTANNGKSGSYVDTIVAFMLLVIPLFLVPFTLRSSNRLMGMIGGAAANVGRQINGVTGRRALGAAGQEMNKKLQATSNFEAMGDRNRLFRGISTIGGAVANPRSLLHGRAGVRSARQARQSTFGAEVLKDNAIFQANQGDDKFLLAVANRDLAEQKLAATRQRYEEARLSGDMAGMTSAQSTMDAQQHALDAAAQLGAAGRSNGVRYQALQSLSKTGFQFEGGAAGYAELSDTVRQLSGGDQRAYSSMMNESQYNLRTAGRFDLGGINDGSGYNPRAGTDKASLYQLANSKPESIQGMMEGIDLNATAPSNEHAVVYKELQAMLPNATGAARDKITENIQHLEDFGVKEYMNQPTGHTREVQDRSGRTVQIAETNGDVAQREARTYERPDPNRLDNQ